MWILPVIVGGICVAFSVISQILEWTHHVDLIQKRWPRLYSGLMNPITRLVLLVVAVALFAEVLREHKSEIKSEPTVPATQTHGGAPQSTGSATTHGDQSPAVTGSGNSFVYGDDAKKEAPKKDKK